MFRLQLKKQVNTEKKILILNLNPIHRAPHGARGLTVLDDETRCWLNDITASI